MSIAAAAGTPRPRGPDVSGLRDAPPGGAGGRAEVPAPRRSLWTRIGIPAVVLAAFGSLTAWSFRDALRTRIDVRVEPVVARAADPGSLTGAVTAQAAGWLEPDPFPIYVPALADGIVAEVLVLEGQAVEAGQVVARLVPDDARLALERAEGDLDAAVAALEEARANWENPVELRRRVSVTGAAEGEASARGEETRRMKEATASMVRELEEQLRRERIEVEAKALPAFDVLRTEFRLEAARADLGAVEARIAMADAERVSAAAEAEAAKEDLRLRIVDRSALARAVAEERRSRAMRDEARLRMDRTEVRAAVAGVVQARLVSPGSKVMALMDSPHSNHVVHLYDPMHQQVRVDVPLADAARVGVGHRARVTVEALPDSVFEGEVTRIVHEADIQKNTLQVKVAVRNPDPALKPEMLARVQFLGPPGGTAGAAAAPAQRLFAPEKALETKGATRAAAWVVDPGKNRVSRREVELGAARREGWVEVVSGLSAGDRVVVDPPAGLKDGTPVRVLGEGK